MWLLVVQEMILALVFSRDRALQLDAALRSFMLQAQDASAARIVVLYRASSARHRSQYDLLARLYGASVSFVAETNFRSQVLDLLDGRDPSDPNLGHQSALAGLYSRSKSKVSRPPSHILFLVDDTVFVRPFSLAESLGALISNTDSLGFSFRLGRNTTYCYALGRAQSLPEFQPLPNRILKFAWPHADGDFGYPFELSSSLYPSPIVVRLVGRLKFSDPSTMESQMASHARQYSRANPVLVCYDESRAFSAPLNRVQQVYENRAGGAPEFSVERLADVFEEGKRIHIQSLSGFVPNACHQEVQLAFESRDA